ncbi:MAG: Rpn family recombination-promoting nuclease/putative transposase, partial [Lachnospiraceae bacterium]|nr:Rpn family recombination-promoting nuclease/putative transposase [Lachnospiraceae bacterium]
LDVEITVNKKAHIDLEMQVINYGNWKERALSYLCRSFDSLTKGSNYIDPAPAVHIGFIDFSLLETPRVCLQYSITTALHLESSVS